jgi:hypothetical protein
VNAGQASLVVLLLAATPADRVAAARRAKQTPEEPGPAKLDLAEPCRVHEPAPGPGLLDPFRRPTAKAAELNAAGKVPYRQGKWEEARTMYRAAIAADPDFLAPHLNIACSFVREERFAEAMTEAVALLDRAYVPWAHEILGAADLGALKPRPEMQTLRAAMASAATRWGEDLEASVLFVARQREPLRVPDGPGVFLLNPQQEVWAFTPRTRRYRQLTAEDGHVVALALSSENRRIVYVTAEKLVRGVKADDLALRGVSIHELILATMTPGQSARIPGDVRRIDVAHGIGRLKDLFMFDIEGDETRGLRLIGAKGELDPEPLPRNAPRNTITSLTGAGSRSLPLMKLGVQPDCGQYAGTRKDKAGQPIIQMFLPESPVFTLTSGHGVGLAGLPIP